MRFNKYIDKVVKKIVETYFKKLCSYNDNWSSTISNFSILKFSQLNQNLKKKKRRKKTEWINQQIDRYRNEVLKIG